MQPFYFASAERYKPLGPFRCFPFACVPSEEGPMLYLARLEPELPDNEAWAAGAQDVCAVQFTEAGGAEVAGLARPQWVYLYRLLNRVDPRATVIRRDDTKLFEKGTAFPSLAEAEEDLASAYGPRWREVSR